MSLLRISSSTATVVLMTECIEQRMTSAKKVLLENALGKARLACVAGQKWQKQKDQMRTHDVYNVAVRKGGKEGANYIAKLVGKNGLIEMLT